MMYSQYSGHILGVQSEVSGCLLQVFHQRRGQVLQFEGWRIKHKYFTCVHCSVVYKVPPCTLFHPILARAGQGFLSLLGLL